MLYPLSYGGRVAAGDEPPGPFVADQPRYDVHSDDSPSWRAAREAVRR
jgi:hypothetical protein